jgi:hypothetical protein
VGAPTIAFNGGYGSLVSTASFTAVAGTAPITYGMWFGSNTTYGSGTAILNLGTGASPRTFTSSIAMPSFYAIVQASNAVGVTTGTASALQTFVGTASSFVGYTSPIDVISCYNFNGGGVSAYFVLSGSSLQVLYNNGYFNQTVTLPAVGKQIAWNSNNPYIMYVLSGVTGVSGYISTIDLTSLNITSVSTYTTFSGIATNGTNLYAILTNGGSSALYQIDPSIPYGISSAIYTITGQTSFNMTFNTTSSLLFIPTSNSSTGVYSTYSMTTAGGSVITYPITQANTYVEFDSLYNTMLFTDGASRIYKLASPWTGTPEVLAGISSAGAIINGNALTTARFNAPRMCRMDTITAGLLVCDTTNNSIRRVL